MSDENVGGLPPLSEEIQGFLNVHPFGYSHALGLLKRYARDAISAHGQPAVDDRMVRGWRNRFISAQTELNQRANGNDYELARAYAEATANEYEEALRAAIGATP